MLNSKFKDRIDLREEDILKKIVCSHNKLYDKYGVKPNAVMISSDYAAIIESEYSMTYQVILGITLDSVTTLDSVLGLDVILILVNGREIIKACIIDKEV